jgi:hypothetical protein
MKDGRLFNPAKIEQALGITPTSVQAAQKGR